MGKSSSQVVGYRYYAKFAAFIGNRIEKLIAINFDNRKWLTRRPGESEPNLAVYAPNLYGENEGGVDGLIDVFIGTPNQQPSEVYQQYLPLVSGYPYQSYLVFHSGSNNKGFYLGNSGYMKEMLLWVKRIHVKNDGQGQWYDEKSEVPIYETIVSEATYPAQTVRRLIFSDSIELDYTNYSRGDGFWGGAGSMRYTYELTGPAAKLIIRQEWGFWGGRSGTVFFPDLPPENITLITDSTNWVGGSYYVYQISVPAGRTSFDVKVNYGAKTNQEGHFIWGSINQDIISEPITISTYDLAGDINPIHKIREILTDDTAMGKPESDVNDANFMKAADRIWDEGLGISWAIDEKSCIDAIEELCYHIEAGIRVNRQTGLYEMVLFRDNWFSEDEIHDIAENKIKDFSHEVMNSDDIVNQLNVTYYDRDRIKNSTFSAYENGSILTMGHANAESVDFPYFMNMRNAEIVANWKLKQFSTPAWSGSFATGWREARKWNRYDLIRLPWSKKWNGTILVRIMKINLGDGVNNTVTIDFEEVVPLNTGLSSSIVIDTPVTSVPQPPQAAKSAAFEMPYWLAVMAEGQRQVDDELAYNPDVGYVVSVAEKPQSNSVYALLYTDGAQEDWNKVSRLNYCDALTLDDAISRTASSFAVVGRLNQSTNNVLIYCNGELMAFAGFDTDTNVLAVKRGILGTMPQLHPADSTLFIFDLADIALDQTAYADTEIVNAKVLTTTPSGVLSLNDATNHEVEIKARAIRPHPPANVKINGAFIPLYFENDFVLTWANRNRLQETSTEHVGYFDANITLEPNTQTLLIVTERDEDGVVLATHNINVTAANSHTLLASVMNANTQSLHVMLKTVRDGYECLNAFDHSVARSNLVAPTNVSFEVIEY